MRPRKLKICVTIGGMRMPIATAKIVKFADVIEPKAELICPKCNGKPKWEGRYTCECGATYTHWSQLKRVLQDGREIVKPKLTQKGEDVEAEVYVMDKEEYAKYSDATLTEYGLTVEDTNSAINLKKLIVALTNLNKVILLHFLDTYEERVAILTLNMGNRIVLKELIPLNIAEIRETMKVDLKGITPKDIQEAEAFIKQLPKADENLLYVSDYRTLGVETKVAPQVLELEQIIEKAKKENAIV